MREFVTRLGRRFQVDRLARAYRVCLLSPAACEYIIPDLAEYCGANDPAPKDGDMFMQGRAAGRRDVWLRLQSFLHLTDEELVALLAGRAVVRRESV